MTSEMARADRDRILTTVARLAIVADGDTVYRDVYLRRAAELLSPIVSVEQYRGSLLGRDQLERLLAQARAAIGREDWAQVRELGTRATALQRTLEADRDLLAVADTIHGAPVVALDPLSPGIGGSKRWASADVARADVNAALAQLETDDSASRELYAARRAALDQLALPAGGPKTEATTTERSGVTTQQRALLALEHGDASGLAELADAMLGRTAESMSAPDAAPTPLARIVVPKVLAEPLPPACLARASTLGLEAAEATASAAVASEIADFMARYALGASPAVHDQARDGVARVSAAAEGLAVPPELVATFAETVALFALHLYVNSAGVRYVPLPVAREVVLVEGHDDGDAPVTPLLRELGFDRRRALARDEIEQRLLERAGAVVADGLGLDPLAFRLVCIPPDLFVRLGGARGWGRREEWTHFDGYQVLRGTRLRALVGGNAHFGGLADLCSISRDDARENTTVRFAVVRRERLAVRIG